MPENNEIAKGLLNLFAEIAEREKKNAISKREYGDASVATVLEIIFKEARKSLDK
jgi:hypothetical protein